jgi:membrane protein
MKLPGVTAEIVRKVSDWSAALQAWDQTHPCDMLGVIVRTVRRFSENYGSSAASSISYYALFSVFPLLIVVVALASTFLSEQMVQKEVMDFILRTIPITSEVLLQEIDRLLQSSTTLNVLAVLGLVWSASGVFTTLVWHINRAWGLEDTRAWIYSYIVALGLVIGLVLLTVLSVVGTVILEVFSRLELVSVVQNWWLPVTFLIRWLLLWGLYRWIPARRAPGMAAFWGALAANLAVELVTFGFSWYVTRSWSYYQLVYGSLGVIIALLFWVYLVNTILLLGAYLAEALHHADQARRLEMKS